MRRNDPRPKAYGINYANSRAHWYFFTKTHLRVLAKKSPFETPALIIHQNFEGFVIPFIKGRRAISKCSQCQEHKIAYSKIPLNHENPDQGFT